MKHSKTTYPSRVDLDNCALEPIHIIGKSQAHGVLLACGPVSFEVQQAGRNTEQFFGISYEKVLGRSLETLIGQERVSQLKKNFSQEETAQPLEVVIGKRRLMMLGHFSGSSLVLDFEPLGQEKEQLFLQKQLSRILNGFKSQGSIGDLCESAAGLCRQIFRYDRVMIYRFDPQWNGEVFAESHEKGMESWLGLHYPATDIPEQSRAMFLRHPVRMIADVHYESVSIESKLSPLSGESLDISRSELRAVSPIHIEYLKNMGVEASLSAAIVVQDRLWGLIACHNRRPKLLDHYQRETCRFLAEVLSKELGIRETSSSLTNFEAAENKRKQLLFQLKEEEDLVAALMKKKLKFTDLVNCGGGAYLQANQWYIQGLVPPKEEIQILLDDHLRQQKENLYYSRSLSSVFSKFEKYKEVASGVLSLRISEDSYILWFRTEVIKTVTWGGNPTEKAFYNEEKKRISPRKSFEKWNQQLSGISEPWQEFDLDIVRKFGEDISYVLLARQRQEIVTLNQKLISANKELELFSYGLSHDLRAPLRGIEGYLDVFKEDFADGVPEEGTSLLERTSELIRRMNQLIDDILEYSRVTSRKKLYFRDVAIVPLVKEVLEMFNLGVNYPRTRISIRKELPSMYGDRRMLFQLWSNLLSNALKYSAKRETPEIEIGFTRKQRKQVFFIKDNGIGIPEEFREKIFQSFTRVAGSGFKGSGIGLAVVKKIIEKHNGLVWVESNESGGSSFFFCTSDNFEIADDNDTLKNSSCRR